MQRNCRRQRSAGQRLFRIPEAAAYIDNVVTVKTLRGWVLRKQIDIVKIGGRVCIPRSALDKLIERGRVPAEARSADSLTSALPKRLIR